MNVILHVGFLHPESSSSRASFENVVAHDPYDGRRSTTSASFLFVLLLLLELRRGVSKDLVDGYTTRREHECDGCPLEEHARSHHILRDVLVTVSERDESSDEYSRCKKSTCDDERVTLVCRGR